MVEEMGASELDRSPGPAGDTRFPVAGLRIWVTGASRGLGRAISLALGANGARLALTARSLGELQRVAKQVEEFGSEAKVLPASVSDPDQIKTCADALRAEWGSLDVLVNCAGVSPIFKRAESISDEEWDHIIAVNLGGTFRCSRAAGEMMIESGGGSIINLSSIHGSVGMPRLAAYSASKGGAEALTRTLALEWAQYNIRVNAIAPGYFETDMTDALRNHDRWRERLLGRIPMSRFGTPADISGTVMYLASSASAYVTGTTITIDGGWTAG
jgi:NAD(P)-dependent dehydrogenase (short-subunit alcohol dehydrogenase family)